MSYRGTLYSEKIPEGKKSVEIHLFHGDLLIARYDMESVEFDLKRAEFTLGGFDNNMLYIYPDSTIKSPALLIQDLVILEEMKGSSNQ